MLKKLFFQQGNDFNMLQQDGGKYDTIDGWHRLVGDVYNRLDDDE